MNPIEAIVVRRRLASRVEIVGNCWVWTGAAGDNGYGRVKLAGRLWTPHRLMYVAVFGEPPEGEDVCHECDVRRCINPYHLFHGTRAVNMQDCVAKGRHGWKNPEHLAATIAAADHRRSIKMADVERVRELLKGGATQAEIAKEYGCTDRTVRHFCNRFGITKN